MIFTPLLSAAVTLDIAGQAALQELVGSDSTFPEFVSGLLGAVMTIAALLVLLYLVWGAFEWISAGGDSGKIEKARTKITQSIVGILVLSSALALFFALEQFLGLKILGGTSSGPRSSGGSSDSNAQRLLDATNNNSSGSTGNSLLDRLQNGESAQDTADQLLEDKRGN